jgi:hypothetical protein
MFSFAGHRCGWQVDVNFDGASAAPTSKAFALRSEERLIVSTQHCQDQSAECRRLMKLAPTEAEAQALKNLSRSWAGLAGQIDRYNTLLRERPRAG